MSRWIGWLVALVAVTALLFGGCGRKDDPVKQACECMSKCADIRLESPQKLAKCKQGCKSSHSEGWEQGSKMATEVLSGTRDTCSP